MIECRPLKPIYTDACPVAYGGVWNDEFVYMPFEAWSGASSLSINMKETLAIEVALQYWATALTNKKVIIHLDNQAGGRQTMTLSCVLSSRYFGCPAALISDCSRCITLVLSTAELMLLAGCTKAQPCAVA